MSVRPRVSLGCSQCIFHSTIQRLPVRTLTSSRDRPATTTSSGRRTASATSLSLMNSSVPASVNGSHASRTNADSSKPIPPTSPRFISIPQSLQPDVSLPRRRRGFLPIARNIFKPKPGRFGRLTTSQTLVQTTSSQERRRGPAPAAHASRNAHLTRLAAMRRDNLRSGIKLLTQRRKRQEARLAARSNRKNAERAALMSAPMREDEQLTLTSVADIITAPLREKKGKLPDPNKAQRMAEKRLRVSVVNAGKAERTQQALHELFVQARSFIVDEEQLDREIESEFGTQKSPRTWRAGEVSVWGQGAPPTLQKMVEQIGRASGPAGKGLKDEDVEARERLMKRRLGKIAEELTGGKMT